MLLLLSGEEYCVLVFSENFCVIFGSLNGLLIIVTRVKMKYCVVVLLTTLAFVVIAVEARTKRKFDSDFTFAEDVSDILWLLLE